MGRFSGFLIWSGTFLLAVFSVCRLPEDLWRNSKNPVLPANRSPGSHINHFFEPFTSAPEKRSALATSAATMAFPVAEHREVCRIVAPAGCMIVIGSVDVSGAAHEISVEAHNSVSGWKLPAEPSNALVVKAEQRRVAFSPRLEADEGEATAECEVIETDSSRLQPILLPASATVEAHRHSVNESGPVEVTQRRFLIPHFEADAVRQEPSLATAICSSRRVTVFLDDSLHSSGSKHIKSSDHVQPASTEPNEVAIAVRICELIESSLLDTISDWIHPVSDLDSDGRLAIVMTDLDRRSIPGQTPVLGCVRERDFVEHATADFAGDIIYLDYRLPQNDELAALLAHELTHAAAASLQLEQTAQPGQRAMRIQPWLNEAAAHWVELQFCEEPAGFSDRVRQFQANPAACPIVAPEALVPLATRRAGSRISAVSFLQRCITEPRNIHRLLISQQTFDETMSDLTGQPFDEIFRSWSIQQGLQSQQSSTTMTRLYDGQTTTTKLHGTSFVVIHGGDAACEVVITSQSRAQLQVTLLVSDGEDINNDQLTAADVD